MNKYKPLSEKYWKTQDGKRIIRYEDVTQLIKDLKTDFKECRDKTDIWDNDRWNKFEKMFMKKLKERIGELEDDKF